MSDTTDTARFWAISGLGWGKGNTPGEAIENYVEAQLRNWPAKSTVYKTPMKWAKALRTGEAKPDVWLAPEGTTGFVSGMGSHWTSPGEDGEDVHTEFRGEEMLDFTAERLEFLASFADKEDSK
jgi:hypothetical protein